MGNMEAKDQMLMISADVGSEMSHFLTPFLCDDVG